jgi:phosphoenolpyruvate-protein phosphotransferase (PTS system enzyme I)
LNCSLGNDMKTELKKEEILLKGFPICRGIAIGKAFVFSFVEDNIPNFIIALDDIELEVQRYRKAVMRSKEEILKLRKELESEKIVEGAAILEAHQQIMQDPLLTLEVEKQIRLTRRNAEYVFHSVIKQYQKKFSMITDPFFRERFKDLQDISRRVMGCLLLSIRFSLADIPEDSIIFAHDFSPADVAEASHVKASALVAQTGSATSHAAIVAKAKGIPYVANIDFERIHLHEDTLVIVDGCKGEIVINPLPETLKCYQSLYDNLHSHLEKLDEMNQLQAETFDGYKIRVSANIDMLNETESLHRYGGNGVGLFRSEYIFLSADRFPSEEEQYLIYRSIVEQMKGLPIVIRTFDVGADKRIDKEEQLQEVNPYLGCRAIRFLLKEKDIFKAQLRAILRASIYGEVSIMFPMIASLSELIDAKNLLRQTKNEVESLYGLNLKPLRIGSMIEVPSAAIISDLLAKECDFLSIGTNDLVQYALAVDRDNPMMSNLYTPTHPCVIRLIKLVVSEANRHGIPVTVCGEVASDPRFTPLLLGLGVHELSVASRFIPIVKNAIRNTSILGASQLAERIMKLSSAAEIDKLLNEEYKTHAPEDCFYNL